MRRTHGLGSMTDGLIGVVDEVVDIHVRAKFCRKMASLPRLFGHLLWARILIGGDGSAVAFCELLSTFFEIPSRPYVTLVSIAHNSSIGTFRP